MVSFTYGVGQKFSQKEVFMKIIFLVLTISMLAACGGKTGDAGSIGATGAPGVSGPTGATGPQGTDGTNGTNGSDGATGPQGVPGTNGTNATPVTVVTLCPGVSTYPSTFVEIALCLNNNLYAVLSEHDGFLTYLPPGKYESKALDSSCDLTVHPGCVISH
jgi:hypothetical protein